MPPSALVFGVEVTYLITLSGCHQTDTPSASVLGDGVTYLQCYPGHHTMPSSKEYICV